jgi:DNA-binding transcriptional regulator YiaG
MATLEQVFQEQKAWIATCDEVDALMEKIAEWRDDVRVAEDRGHQHMRMRAGDLVELGQNKVVRLKAVALRAEEDAKRTAGKPPEWVVAPARATMDVPEGRPSPERPQKRVGADRSVREAAEQAQAAEARAAATRLANAQAAKIEAEAALARARAATLAKAAGTPTTAMAARAAPVPANVAGTQAVGAAHAPTPSRPRPAPMTKPQTAPRPRPEPAPPVPKPVVEAIPEADRLALASVGRWPPSGPAPGHPFWSRDHDWPAEWTLTGLDLARFRGRINVTQKVLAAQLGVPTAQVADLERRPREKVGPAMQIALRRAMDVVEADERKRREAAATERAAQASAATSEQAPTRATASPAVASPSPAPAVAEQPAVQGPAAPAPVTPVVTGADLARLRAERRLSQRQFAEQLGVGYGMVAKTEVAGSEPLGERMREAVRAMLAASGGATG